MLLVSLRGVPLQRQQEHLRIVDILDKGLEQLQDLAPDTRLRDGMLGHEAILEAVGEGLLLALGPARVPKLRQGHQNTIERGKDSINHHLLAGRHPGKLRLQLGEAGLVLRGFLLCSLIQGAK